MRRYAQNTNVSVEKSRTEIETILQRYGASKFVSGWEQSNAMIGFECRNKFIRFTIRLPDREDDEFTRTPSRGDFRSPQAAEKAWEQACRSRWRALALCIKDQT